MYSCSACDLIKGVTVFTLKKPNMGCCTAVNSRRWTWMPPHGDEFPAVKFLRRFRRFTVDEDMAAVDQFLHARAREFRAMRGHKPVEPRASVSIHRQKLMNLGFVPSRHELIVASGWGSRSN